LLKKTMSSAHQIAISIVQKTSGARLSWPPAVVAAKVGAA